MNYYEFLYRWTMFESGEGYYFNCSGMPCSICPCFVEWKCLNSEYHRQSRYPTNWNTVHALANQLLKEGLLCK